ncbi:DUF3891 family protein [Oceanobacillus saliphilus]|uniref:DUF3891 family protein n=1 Tax=Oceanobacillus saliphilus TaxID=2925834 RepID=UPI00201D960B|nr:DUF3891 family protein [Oceanobacillus saliphilus]
MIVREREHDYVLIQQDHHAQISGDILKQWKADYFYGQELRESVEYAAYQHDHGWKEFDKQPFLNDKEKTPYSFFDFPNLPKIILYKHGIDEVEKVDPYAAMLCSEHYKRFLVNNTSLEAQAFVTYEELRQQTIVDTLDNFNKRLFEFHYGLIQLADNLSLYVCMNEPGVEKQDEHSFFKNGIPTNEDIHEFCKPKLHLKWQDANTVVLDDFPFNGPINVNLKQKVIQKKAICTKGLIDSYEEAPFEEHPITYTANSKQPLFS